MSPSSKQHAAAIRVVIITLTLATVACNFPLASAQITPTPTLQLTASPTAPAPGLDLTATATTTLEPGVTPTATVCTYNARYLEDITVPDGTEFTGGTAFDKTWSMENTGCLNWPIGTQLVFVRGDQMGAPNAIEVPLTAVGGRVNLTVPMKAPETPGEYTGYWQLHAPGNIPFGPEIFVNIVVKEPSGKPDLIVSNFNSSPSPALTDVALTYRVTVKNQGQADAPASKLTIQPQGLDPITLDIPALAKDAIHEATATITYTDPGTYAYAIAIDATSVVAEANEGNNTRIGNIDVFELETRTGTASLALATCFDLDTGTSNSCGTGTDFLWQEVSGSRYLTLDGATAALMAAAPSFHTCAGASFSGSAINGTNGPGNQIPAGTHICFKTSEGRYAFIRIASYGSTLGIEFTVWDLTGR